jgi:hypothetical protein
METLVLLMMGMLGAAVVAAVGTYHISHRQLVKARTVDAEFISLVLALFSFGAVIVVVYFMLLDRLISQWW